MVPCMPRRIVARQPPPVPEVNRPHVVERAQPVGGYRHHRAEERVERVPVHHPRAGHQPGGVGQVPRALLVHHDLRGAEHRGDVAHAARVVQMNMRDDDGSEIRSPDPERAERGLHDRR